MSAIAYFSGTMFEVLSIPIPNQDPGYLPIILTFATLYLLTHLLYTHLKSREQTPAR